MTHPGFHHGAAPAEANDPFERCCADRCVDLARTQPAIDPAST
jgi:hypothetical protein